MSNSITEILDKICGDLDDCVKQISSSLANNVAANLSTGNWALSGLSRDDLVLATEKLADWIRSLDRSMISQDMKGLEDYPSRLQPVRQTMIPNFFNGSPQGLVAIPNYLATLSGIRAAIENLLPRPEADDIAQRLVRARYKIRATETRVSELELRSQDLDSIIGRILDAREAADQLPTDLQSLSESRGQIGAILKSANIDSSEIEKAKESALKIEEELKIANINAAAVLERAEKSYSAATSQGLAAAFSDRSKQLTSSMWIWVGGLVMALSFGAFYGSHELHDLVVALSSPSGSSENLAPNVLISLLSISAPIWFGWLSTKQIGQRFRLSEDYAFKASISRAYEGYRKEAARINPDLEAKLLESALARLDEQPLRLVETASYGSPWHELVDSGAMKTARRTVPGFAAKINKLAKSAQKSRPPESNQSEEV